MPKFICKPCEYTTDRKANYEGHLKTDKHLDRITLIQAQDIETKYKLSIETIQDLSKTVENLKQQNQDLKVESLKQKESYECQLDNKDKVQMKRIISEANLITKCSMLEDEVRSLREIAKKPVNITNNNTNYKTVNKILNVISPEAIDYTQIHKYLTAEVASKGPEAVANAVHDNLLMDSNGKPKVICTDPSRNKFKVKDPNTGDLIDDLNLEGVKLGIRDQI